MGKILYTPEITYKKDYSTDGLIENKELQVDKPVKDTTDDTTIKDISSTIDDIKSAFEETPEDIKDAIKDSLKGIEYVIDNLIDPSYDPDAKEISVIINENKKDHSNSEEEESEYPDLFPDIDDDMVVTVDIKNVSDLVDNDFTGDIASIFNDFTNNMQEILANYYSSLIATCSEVGITNISSLNKKYDGSSSDVDDSLKHVSDSIIKSQIIKDQKLRLFKKIYDTDNMIGHIRACKTSSELKKRYYKTDFTESSDLLDIVQNDMLSSIRFEIDKKYKENLFNLYKYLNSSVILINECLNMNLKEAQGKALLISREGITL